MGTYNILKDLTKTHTTLQPSPITTFVQGALAGIVTVYATQPFDTIKTRSQGVGGTGATQAFLSVLRGRDGVKGFWRGSTMRLGRWVFSGGIIFTVYEGVLDLVYVRKVGVDNDLIDLRLGRSKHTL